MRIERLGKYALILMICSLIFLAKQGISLLSLLNDLFIKVE